MIFIQFPWSQGTTFAFLDYLVTNHLSWGSGLPLTLAGEEIISYGMYRDEFSSMTSTLSITPRQWKNRKCRCIWPCRIKNIKTLKITLSHFREVFSEPLNIYTQFPWDVILKAKKTFAKLEENKRTPPQLPEDSSQA